MTKNKINTERLQKFAEYLSTKKIKSVNLFGAMPEAVMMEYDGSVTPINVITFLAIFELPCIFPNDWGYDEHFEPCLIKPSAGNAFVQAQRWFGLSDAQMEHLFFQGMQNCKAFGGKNINLKSTELDLVFNIQQMLKKHIEYNNQFEFKICLN